MTQVSQKANIPVDGLQQKANRVLRIMGDSKGFHGDVSQFKTASGAEDAAVQFDLELILDCLSSGPVAIHRDFELFGQLYQPLYMIRMLVSD